MRTYLRLIQSTGREGAATGEADFRQFIVQQFALIVVFADLRNVIDVAELLETITKSIKNVTRNRNIQFPQHKHSQFCPVN